ncbi:cytosine permease [Archaeoglobus profundus]|uniref:Permease for cytosine/purines uracil thiamine allantoin n=1 Tax=Archaeoglobus profundus (strain DSM 5631 / JCM 9629 / NBRC 100127 / Av18) TaxID=572546 RepID=D2REB3_ARCPA|nr:cytosine permease [Archaeoglobus profundus]ADB58457.1 permease for cytosine/purines uracil thiamine allantoin [Archaeoglobus profundus DSM 5631]
MKEDGIIEKHAIDAIPLEERQPWYSIAMIWIGVMICIPALMIGGALVSGLPLKEGILAGVAGYTIIILIMTFTGMQGADLGRPAAVISRSAFGVAGSRVIISLILAVGTIGWFGVQANVAGLAFSSIMKTWVGADIPVWISSLVWGLIMLTTAVIGYKALEYLNYIAVPALLILSLYGTYVSIQKFGLETLVSHSPPSPFPFIQGVALTVGSFAVGATIAADYSRYAKNRRDAVLSSVVGVWPAGVGMLAMGAIMSVVAGTYDITEVLSTLGLSGIALVILILATWTTNTINAYSGGLALANMFNLPGEKRALATVIAGVIGTVLAVGGILDHFIDWLSLLTSTIPPLAGVLIADYWILRSGKPEKWEEYPGVNWIGVVAWIAGSAVGLLLKMGIAPINGIVTAMVVYLVLWKLIKRE